MAHGGAPKQDASGPRGAEASGADGAVAFAEFFAAWATRSRAEFLAHVTCPYLVMPRVEGRAVADDGVTGRVDPAHTIATWDLQLLLPVTSSGERVTIGRAPTNDVV